MLWPALLWAEVQMPDLSLTRGVLAGVGSTPMMVKSTKLTTSARPWARNCPVSSGEAKLRL